MDGPLWNGASRRFDRLTQQLPTEHSTQQIVEVAVAAKAGLGDLFETQ